MSQEATAMSLPSRRIFLGTALGGLATNYLLGVSPGRVPPTAGKGAVSYRDTLFLTWQRDPTTTMTVQWVGEAGPLVTPAVHYSSTKSLYWAIQPVTVRPYPRTNLRLFRAELTGLSPGTDYLFRIGSESPTYRFRTAPAKATDTLTFVSGGDCGVNPHAVANNIQAARQDPLFVLIGGDLGYDNGKSAATSLAFLRNYSKHAVARDGRLIPLIACLGNHEVDGGYKKPRSKAPFFFALFDGLYSHTSYATLDFGAYLSLVLLDTGHISSIGGEQADWLERTLRARKDHPHVVVVNHVPAYPSFRPMGPIKGKEGTGAHNRKFWVPLFEKYRVPVVLEHHDHTFKRTRPLLDGRPHDNGVLYLGDGSWGMLRTPSTPQKLPFLAVSSRDYHLSVHRIQGQERYHLALDERGRVMDLCRSGQRKLGLVGASG